MIKRNNNAPIFLFLMLLALYPLQALAAELRTEYREKIAEYEDAAPSAKIVALISLMRAIDDDYPAAAIEFADDASELIALATNDQQIRIAAIRCWSNYSLGKLERAKLVCSQLLVDAATAGKNDGQAQAKNVLGIIAFDEGEDAEGLRLLNQAIAIAEAPGIRAAAHDNAGSMLKDRGAYDQAFEHFTLALQESRDPSLTVEESCYYSSGAAFEISDINSRLGDLPSAVRYIESALVCAETIQHSWDHVAALTVLTRLLLESGEVTAAEQRSIEAMAVAQSRDKVIVSMASRARATVLRHQGKVDEALAMATSAVDKSAEQPFGIIRLNSVILLAELYSETGQHAKALGLLSKLESEARTLSRFDMLERVLEVQPAIYQRNQDLALAYAKQQELAELSRSNLKQSTLRRMTLLQSQLDFEQQEKAAKQAQVLQRAAETQATKATFTRNVVIAGGLLLLLVGYLAISRRFQVRQVTQATAAKRVLEAELREQSHALRQQAADNLELETQMLHTQKLEAVGQLTGGIAHDFNNLMVVVMGAIELVRDSNKSTLDAADRELLMDASEAVLSGTDITRQLLAYARKQPLDPAPTEISALLGSTETMLGRVLGDRISLVTSPIEEPIWCEIDRAQLVTALLNLTINARDAMTGVGELHLQCSREASDPDHPTLQSGEYCKLVIRDSGSGIAPEDLDRVTEPFYTTKALGNGHGLGLSMVYGFVKQSNGELLIHSTVGKGTDVTMWLPLCDEPPEPQSQSVEIKRAGTAANKKMVLVVEDQPQVLLMAEKILIELGYEVLIATSGMEAKQLIVDGVEPAAVFSDVSMPGELDGLALAQWLRVYSPNMPVLLTSGYPQEQVAQAGITFITKPYRSHQLGAVLEQMISEWATKAN